jgi:P27 family predicted phage terminase small subunit
VSKEAVKIFRRLCKLLAQRRALTAGDGEILGLYCVLFDRHNRALAALEKEGEIVTQTRVSRGGEPYEIQARNPWLDVAKDCERQRVAILDRLGLNPRSKDAVKPGGKARSKEIAVMI